MAKNRVMERQHMDVPTRMTLAESDADSFQEELQGCREELAGIRKVLTGLLISITTGVLMAVAAFALSKV